MQGACAQETSFRNSEMAEQGGENTASTKKPVFTKNVIISTAVIIVVLLVGSIIYFGIRFRFKHKLRKRKPIGSNLFFRTRTKLF